MRVKAIVLAGIAVAFGSSAFAQGGDKFRVGVLTDMSGGLSAITGPGSVVAAQLAVADFGGQVLGRTIEVVTGDHQNKADIGAALASRWYDSEGVEAILDAPNSSVVLATQNIARERKKVLLVSGAGTADLTGKACSPTGIHWTWDTYAIARGTSNAVIAEGGDSWFFLTADYAFGHAMERDASAVVQQRGGTVAGAVRHPSGTSDFSSFLLQAQASKAKILALANAGADAINSIKQANEFGIIRGGQKLVGLAFFISDVHALGLPNTKGLLLTTGFYWDRNDETRAWSKRFFEKFNAMPTMTQAGVYSSLMHYLNAVKAVGRADGEAVVGKMKATPVNDFFARDGKIRPDGRMVYDLYLVQVKAPEESRYPWDYYKIVRTIPGDQAFRPLAESECPLVKK